MERAGIYHDVWAVLIRAFGRVTRPKEGVFQTNLQEFTEMAREFPPPKTYAYIPNPVIWGEKFKAEWFRISESICPKCGRPIGYHKLAYLGPDGWEHSPCPQQEKTEAN